MFIRDDKPPRKRFSNGYTLPETLAVIVITGLLAGIAIPSYLAIVDRVRCLNLGKLNAVNPRCPLEATITNPGGGSKVPRVSKFNGTFKNLPKDKSMWVYVYATIEHKFYYRQVADDDLNYLTRTWELEGFYTGTEGDTGKSFKVGIFIAERETTIELLAEGGDSRDYLPTDVTRFSEREITRQ